MFVVAASKKFDFNLVYKSIRVSHWFSVPIDFSLQKIEYLSNTLISNCNQFIGLCVRTFWHRSHRPLVSSGAHHRAILVMGPQRKLFKTFPARQYGSCSQPLCFI